MRPSCWEKLQYQSISKSLIMGVLSQQVALPKFFRRRNKTLVVYQAVTDFATVTKIFL